MAEQLQHTTGTSDEVFLTGATGFVGSHVLHALLAAGYHVRALVRPASRPLPLLEGCTVVEGDLLRPGELIPHLAGCRYLVHTAALYSFSPGAREQMFATNVSGSAGILEAAERAGIERSVVTSSSSTVGPSHGSRPATEDDWDVETGSSAYHLSKLQQARIALAARNPVVLVLPTAPVGPGDWKPTPTGKMVEDFMRGRMFVT
jgi:dihydroflavonol-4-reductase